MLVKILKQPSGRLDGMELKRYILGESYNVSPSVADYLVLNEFAIVDVRGQQRSHRQRPNERRHSSPKK
jgi:hypothetical protein